MKIGLGLGLVSKSLSRQSQPVQFPSANLSAYWNFQTIGESTASLVGAHSLFQSRWDSLEDPLAVSDVVTTSGKIGNGALLPTNTDPIANPSQLRYLSNTSFTPNLTEMSVAAWVKLGTGGIHAIAGRWDGSSTAIGDSNLQFILFVDADGYAGFAIGDPEGTVIAVPSQSTVTDNQWHLLVGTYKYADSVMKLSVDNSEFVFTTVTSALNNSDYPLEVGGNYAQSNSLFNGVIDELAFWDRELTQQEVALLWNNGSGITYQP